MDKRIGAQLYTVRDYTKTLEDFDKTLEKVAAIGYKSVRAFCHRTFFRGGYQGPFGQASSGGSLHPQRL